jgi:hypothetical protein
MQKSDFWNSISLYVWAPKRLDRFYSHSVFRRLSIIGQCPENTNIPAKKKSTFHRDPPKQNLYILKNVSNDFDYISVIYRDYISK